MKRRPPTEPRKERKGNEWLGCGVWCTSAFYRQIVWSLSWRSGFDSLHPNLPMVSLLLGQTQSWKVTHSPSFERNAITRMWCRAHISSSFNDWTCASWRSGFDSLHPNICSAVLYFFFLPQTPHPKNIPLARFKWCWITRMWSQEKAINWRPGFDSLHPNLSNPTLFVFN
jgi:hypothetical protein